MQDLNLDKTVLDMHKRNMSIQNQYSVAMCYVPWQKFEPICEDLGEGFKGGTIFPELVKPFQGRRCLS